MLAGDGVRILQVFQHLNTLSGMWERKLLENKGTRLMKSKIFNSKHSLKFLVVMISIVSVALVTPLCKFAQAAVRLKDVAYVEGVRDNQLYGYGLVIGLQGTGDNAQIFKVTRQMAVNIFEKMGLLFDDEDFFSRNVAAVMVTANIPAFVRPGDTLDVTVSSIGDCKSLEGGVLLQTALQGADNEVYAVAQGPLAIGGFNIEGNAQSSRKNISTTGRIASGAIVEKEIQTSIFYGKSMSIVLHEPDFTTANRTVEAINNLYPDVAKAVDAAIINIIPPKEFQTDTAIVQFVANLEELYITTDSIARVIVNERTGTIVAHENVRISTVAVAHGNLSITITEEEEVSQPNALASGNTEKVDRTEIKIDEQERRLHVIDAGVSISDVARALNLLGVTPRDLISIFQAIKRAGALHAELVIM
ncbi:MAG: flagellar basal body P-ring protein FlgI [Candidatus Brocadiaceae bacterium]|nr:flagellar basal body P-ring protein FlgI [Candidatus Brocadiaceae bacterium]